MSKSPEARTVFLSPLIEKWSDPEPASTRILKDRELAARIRDLLAEQLNHFDDPLVLVVDLAGSAYTPSTLQELILPLAQRIRGGEHGRVRFALSTTDPGVSDFIRYMAQAHQLPLYLLHSPFDLSEGTPLGALTETEKHTLDTINLLGGQVTASGLAASEGIGASAAANRLVNLDREGYLVRQPRRAATR